MANEAPLTDMDFAPRMVFDVASHNGTVEGEDWNFCRRWRAMGGMVHIDPGIALMHFAGEICLEKPYAAAHADGTTQPPLPPEPPVEESKPRRVPVP
jgi:hypothetical protein